MIFLHKPAYLIGLFRFMAGVALVLGVFSSIIGTVVAEMPPRHLAMLSATIEELPPLGWEISGRKVALSIEVAGAPECSVDHPDLNYGFLIDADRNEGTGAHPAAFAGLGVDAKVTAHCDPERGVFISPAGSVTVAPSPDGNTFMIQIVTVVDQLPAIRFRWIAYAAEKTNFVRLPESPFVAAWAIYELMLY